MSKTEKLTLTIDAANNRELVIDAVNETLNDIAAVGALQDDDDDGWVWRIEENPA